MPKGCNSDMNTYLRTQYSISTSGAKDTGTLVVRYIKATGGDATKAYLALLAAAKT